MKLTLHLSTCPNDTFMFYALIHGKAAVNGVTFAPFLADIEELNRLSIEYVADISKISFGVYPEIAKTYQLLNSGSALGKGVGPLLISKRKIYPDEVAHAAVGIPGKHTTAHLLFNRTFPDTSDKRFYLFSDIEEAVLESEIDAGVIIHESRFTYMHKGLRRIVDLGEEWEQDTGLPVPLGGIAIKRNLPERLKAGICRAIRESIEYAYRNPEEVMPFVKKHARELSDEVIQKHINLYVNSHSLNLEQSGRKAIEALLNISGTPDRPSGTFINSF